jgi:sulfatase maturation enzyme AslB (radical SAM superfamily)
MVLYPSFSLGLNFTVNRLNFADMQRTLSYSEEKNLGLNFTLAALSEIGVESVYAKDFFAFAEEEKGQIKDFFQALLSAGRMHPKYGKFLLHWLETGKRFGPCAFKRGISVLIEPDCSVYQCGNFNDFKLGNLLESIFSQIAGKKNGFNEAYESRCKTCNSNCYIEAL